MMNATQILDATTLSAQYSLGQRCRSKNIIAHPCTTRNLFYASTCTFRDQNQTQLLEFIEEENKINRIDSFDNEGIINQIIPDLNDPQRFYTIFSQYTGTQEKSGFNLKSASINAEGQISTEQSKVPIFSFYSEKQIHSLMSKLKESNRIYFGVNDSLNIFDLSKQQVVDSKNESAAGSSMNSVDPHHNDLIVSAQNDGSILIHDLRAGKPQLTIKQAHKLKINDIDFNPLKLYCFQSIGEDCTLKFWEIRKLLPLKVIERLNNIPLSSKFNKNHDQLIITAFNDGSLGLYRVISVSSYPDPQSSQKEEDGLVKIYDQHENTVYSATWSNCSSWIFASVSYEGNVTVNMVPSSIKHRILY